MEDEEEGKERNSSIAFFFFVFLIGQRRMTGWEAELHTLTQINNSTLYVKEE
jgi:hypothetical protein